MSVGLGVLKKIIEEQSSLSVLTENGLTSSFFVSNEKKALAFISGFFLRYNSLPQVRTVEEETHIKFPEFADEPLEYWFDHIKKRYKLSIAQKSLDETGDDVSEGELDEATEKIKKLYLDLTQDGQKEKLYTLKSLYKPVIDRYKKIQSSGDDIFGVPFGIPSLDRTSSGAQPGDSIAIIGRPGSSKSYLLLNAAMAGSAKGHRVMVETLEMPAEQCMARLYGLKGNIPVSGIRKGKLSWWGERKLERTAQGFESADFYIYEGTFNTTFEDLLIKVQEVQPDILYVDGAYLLKTRERTGARWERIAATAEGLKSLSLTANIPVVGTYQFNRKGSGDLAHIGGSDAIGQLASIVLSMRCSTKINEKGVKVDDCRNPIKYLEIIKGREGESMSITLNVSLQQNIGITEINEKKEEDYAD